MTTGARRSREQASLLQRPANPPGLPRLAYRLGTFATFRTRALDALALALPDWRPDDDGSDAGVLLVETWAYVADVLAFYQEQIANEAYLGTATSADSLRRLAALVGYHPNPGAAARTSLSFRVGPGRSVPLPAGFRVASRGAPPRAAAVFETDVAASLRGENNVILPVLQAAANQFAPLPDVLAVLGELHPAAGVTTGGAGGLGTPAPAASADLPERLATVFPGLPAARPAPHRAVGAAAPPSPVGTTAMPTDPQHRRTVFLAGVRLRVRPGDLILVVDRMTGAGPADNGRLRQVVSVVEDRAAQHTAVTWIEDPGYRYASDAPEVFRFGLVTAAHGADAPLHATLPPLLTTPGQPHGPASPPYPTDWDTSPHDTLPDGPAAVLRIRSPGADLPVHSAEAPSLAVLLTTATTPQRYQTFAITGVDTAAATDFPPPVQVRQLHLSQHIVSGTFPRRTTMVLTGTERLPLVVNLPLPDRLPRQQVVLQGIVDTVTTDHLVIVRGELLDSQMRPTGVVAGETAVITRVLPDRASGTTTATLRTPLTHDYRLTGCVVLGNVVPAGQGTTVRGEVLGSGDGSAWQMFRLRRTPLTYLPDAGADTGVSPVLAVDVNGVEWDRRTSLADAAPEERAYVLDTTGDGATTITFGEQSARPPTGRDNVRARYRFGLGPDGALGPDTVTTLVDSRPGLAGVTNPLRTAGAAGPEGPAAARHNAPARVRTFGRIVSVEDYATVAASFPGVGMARARLHATEPGRRPQPVVLLTVAGQRRDQLDPESVRLLRAHLDARRDSNVPLRIVPFLPVYVDVEVVVDVEAGYGRAATVRAVRAALAVRPSPAGHQGYFASLGFGDSVHLSAVTAAAAGVTGVRDVTVTRLADPAEPPGTVRDHILVAPTWLAVVGDDPADVHNRTGRLVVQLGTGGFDDT